MDNNIVYLIVKKNYNITRKVDAIKFKNHKIFISCITYFEVRRGFLAVDAPKQRERFNNLWKIYPIILLDDLAIFEKAAEIHKPLRSWGANLRLRGLPIETEDILIAATAMVKG